MENPDYIILKEDLYARLDPILDKLQEQVQEKILEGYVPQGGVSQVGHFIVQAMVKLPVSKVN